MHHTNFQDKEEAGGQQCSIHALLKIELPTCLAFIRILAWLVLILVVADLKAPSSVYLVNAFFCVIQRFVFVLFRAICTSVLIGK
jgi:hypothetical protein